MPDSARDRHGVVCVFQRPIELGVGETRPRGVLRAAHRCDRFGSDAFENRAGSPAEDAAQSVERRARDSAGARRDVFQRPLLYLFRRGAGDFALRAVAVGHRHLLGGRCGHRRVLRDRISAGGLVFPALPAPFFPDPATVVDVRRSAHPRLGLVRAVRTAQLGILPSADRLCVRVRDGRGQRAPIGGGQREVAGSGVGSCAGLCARGGGHRGAPQLSLRAAGHPDRGGVAVVGMGADAGFLVAGSPDDSRRGGGPGNRRRFCARGLQLRALRECE